MKSSRNEGYNQAYKDIIEFWNPYTEKKEVEKVYASFWVRFFYRHPLGKLLEHYVVSRKWFSLGLGWYHNSAWSKKKIGHFIEQYNIAMQEFEAVEYRHFNDFFIRAFRPGARVFAAGVSFPAFAEGRYLVYAHQPKTFQIKGQVFAKAAILGQWGSLFSWIDDASVLIARLCPVDYHQFHFFDQSEVLGLEYVSGRYQSVNPWALHPYTYCHNERIILHLKTEHFGEILVVVIGALGVGKIVLHQKITYPKHIFKRGESMGYFLFGASSVIVFAPKNVLSLAPYLLGNTAQDLETFIKLGQTLGEKTVSLGNRDI